MAEETTNTLIEGFNNFLAPFKDFIELCKREGVGRVFLYLFAFAFFSYMIYITTHPQVIFEKYEEYSEKIHSESFNKRIKASPQIQSCLNEMRYETDAYRCFVIEMHNGKYNAAGLSFNYGALTYESAADTTSSVIDDYLDFALERYPILLAIHSDGYWEGTADELVKIDKHLGMKIRSNGSEYIALRLLYGENGEIGFIGLTYSEPEPKTKKLRVYLTKYGAKISPLLGGRGKR